MFTFVGHPFPCASTLKVSKCEFSIFNFFLLIMPTSNLFSSLAVSTVLQRIRL
jgi:hypothetical protein